MNDREITQEVRLRQWTEVLREQKASGESIKGWCETQGIPRQRFFYWQRKLREAACALAGREMSGTQAPEGWALCARVAVPGMLEPSPSPALSEQVCVEINGMRILAGQAYPEDKLARLLRELTTQC
jgi:hypothetical protein